MKIIREYLIKKLLKKERLIDIESDLVRLGRYLKLDNKETMELLHSRLTDNIINLTMMGKEKHDENLGRVLENLNLIKNIENAEEGLRNIEKRKKLNEIKKSSTINKLKQKIIKYNKI